MSLATVVQGSATRAFKINGVAAPATLAQVTTGIFDPTTGTTGAGATVTTSTSALLSTLTKRIPGGKFGPNSLIEESDLFATILGKGLATDPAPGDTLTFRGATWTVKGVWPTFVGATPVIFELWVRK